MGLKSEYHTDAQRYGGRVWKQGTQGWVLVAFLGRVICVTVGERKRPRTNRKWWGVARLWRAFTLILRSWVFIL